ncbi:MAG: 50S ribosomal protein L17 [Elusimicrobiales bacterium]|nr:50S ribosomal protein L17 [Elusimicrobiales bacterium]
MIKNLGHRKLSKTGSHRKAMLTNMAVSLLMHEHVNTTLAKAKEVRRVVERVITDARKGRHMEVRKVVRSKTAFKKLMEVLAPRYADRNGGYTRILHVGRRKGDDADMGLVKLVE